MVELKDSKIEKYKERIVEKEVGSKGAETLMQAEVFHMKINFNRCNINVSAPLKRRVSFLTAFCFTTIRNEFKI